MKANVVDGDTMIIDLVAHCLHVFGEVRAVLKEGVRSGGSVASRCSGSKQLCSV